MRTHPSLFSRGALLRTLMAATVAVGANALSVSAQARWRFWRRMCGERALVCHAAAIAPAWLWFLLEEQGLERAQERSSEGRYEIVGGTLSLVAAVLVVAGFRKLGPGTLLNADVFDDSPREWQTGGPYAIVRDPIYMGYGLSLAGRAVRWRSAEIMVVAAWLAVLLITVEAPAERWAHTRAMQAGPAPG